MKEEPKSLWKKSRRGIRSYLLAWLAVLVTAPVIFAIFTLATKTPFTHAEFGILLFFGVFVSILFLLGVFIQWLISIGWRRMLFALACFATLIALFYAEEDWRGWHAWNKFKSQWEAKGEKFDWQSVVPPPVPDDQNFAMAPIWAELIAANIGTNFAQRYYGEASTRQAQSGLSYRLQMGVGELSDYNGWPKNGNWEKATITDLKLWQNYYRALAAKTNGFPVAPQPQTPAEDVLLALSKFNPVIEQLRQDSARPDSRFPLGYASEDKAAIILPHLSVLKRCSEVLQLRTIAELQNNESDKALADVKLMLYLVNSIRSEPILISHLVRIAMTAIALQPVYEGLVAHKWSDAQLAELDAEMAKLDFLADYEFSMRGERIFGISETEYLRRSRNLRAMSFDAQGDPSSPPFSSIGFYLAPASFFYWNELTIARMHQQWTLPLVDMENRVVSPRKVSQSTAAADMALQHGWPYNILARMIFPAVGEAIKQYAHEQSSIDLARVAIALERYRLAHGEYPGSLDVLAPQFIAKVPHDVIGGGPLHYRRDPPSQSSGAAGGQFVLYSVGWNETDDGGAVVFMGKGKNPRDESNSSVDINKGDWVWRYPKAE